MSLTITDESLQAMRMDQQEARIEIACRLFDAAKISFGHAAKLAQVSEEQLHEEMEKRNIPRYRYTAQHLAEDLEALRRMKGHQATAGS